MNEREFQDFIDSEHFFGLCDINLKANEVRSALGLPRDHWHLGKVGRRYKCPNCSQMILTSDQRTHEITSHPHNIVWPEYHND